MKRIACCLALLAASAAAAAGECRAGLRPLLLNPDAPAAAELDRVRSICEAEAGNGDADASYQLALTYLGLGGEWQPERAVPMIRDAAARGISEAQYWLAWQYEAGPMLEHDGATALGWYLRAAEQNHRLALARLATAYERGELGLPADMHKAIEYHAREARCVREQAAKDLP